MSESIYHIIGGGPVGLASALLLAKQGYQSIVYEGRSEIPTNIQESYPIGINPRSLKTLEIIDPELANEAMNTGKIVDSWQIYGGNRRFAKLDSRVVYGTSRGKVNTLLYEWAKKNDKITVLFDHKLIDINFQTKELLFEKITENRVKLQVSVKADRVLAADGLHSMVRKRMDTQCEGFQSIMKPWVNEYRVLFAKPGQMLEGINPEVHYLFGGCYSATVDIQGQQTWTFVMGVKDDASDEEKELILAKQATPEKIQALKKKINQKAPIIASLFQDEEEIAKYFTRRTFRGAVVKVNRLNEGEFVCLLGDAAHSVLPPTGEGINSGLEDCMILWECIKNNPQNCFNEFNKRRFPDTQALFQYADYLNSNPWFSGERVSRRIFTIVNGFFTTQTVSNQLFGPMGTQRKPYREIISDWNSQKRWQLNFIRFFVYLIALAIEIIISPITITRFMIRQIKGKQRVIDNYTTV